MTKTIREQLQALVDEYKWLQSAWTETLLLDSKNVINNLESILATEPPAVTVRKGWYAKDANGLAWFKEEPKYAGYGSWYPCDPDSNYINDIDGVIIDPWEESHPNGGPECVMEVNR